MKFKRKVYEKLSKIVKYSCEFLTSNKILVGIILAIEKCKKLRLHAPKLDPGFQINLTFVTNLSVTHFIRQYSQNYKRIVTGIHRVRNRVFDTLSAFLCRVSYPGQVSVKRERKGPFLQPYQWTGACFFHVKSEARFPSRRSPVGTEMQRRNFSFAGSAVGPCPRQPVEKFSGFARERNPEKRQWDRIEWASGLFFVCQIFQR